MNIQNIQSAQAALSAIEGQRNSAKEITPATQETVLPDSQSLLQDQGDAFQIEYPPFFPIGNTQGIYSDIIAATQETSSSGSVTATQEVDDTTHPEAVAVDQQVDSGESGLPQIDEPMVAPGAVLHLTA